MKRVLKQIGALATGAVAMIILTGAFAQASHPLYYGTYDGSEDRLLAETQAGAIREKDFLLFLVMKRSPMPDQLNQYLTESDYRLRQELRERLHLELEEYALMMAAPDLPMTHKHPTAIDAAAAETFVYPVYDWVWSDWVVKSELGLTDLDLRKFYHNHAEKFIRPELIQTRVIFLRASYDEGTRSFEDAEDLLLDLSQQIRDGADFGALAAQYSEAPSGKQGGQLPLSHEGAFFAEFEDVVGDLDEGEMSEPFQGVGGMYLVLLEKRLPAQLPPFSAIRDDVQEALQPHALRYRQAFNVSRLRQFGKNAFRPQAFDSANPEAWLVQVGDYRLTSADFLRIYPEVLTPDAMTNRKSVSERAGGIFFGELMKAECVLRNLMSDPRLVRAKALAPRMLRARRLTAEKMQPFLAPTEEQLRQFHSDHPELFEAIPRRAMVQISVTLREPETMEPAQVLSYIEDAQDQLIDLMDNQMILIKNIDVMAVADDENDTATVAQIRRMDSYVETLSVLDPDLYDVRIQHLEGYFTGADVPAELTPAKLAALNAYEYVGPAPYDDAAVFWICESVEGAEAGYDYEQVEEFVRREFNRVHNETARQQIVEEALNIVDPTWRYDALPYTPSYRPRYFNPQGRVQAAEGASFNLE